MQFIGLSLVLNYRPSGSLIQQDDFQFWLEPWNGYTDYNDIWALTDLILSAGL